MKVKAKLNMRGIKAVDKMLTDSLVETADALKSDVQQSQTMPFDTGQMQNRSMSIDSTKKRIGRVTIVTDTPYARRMYFHPEFNFKQDKNKHAGALWWQPYIDGNKKNFATKTFARIMKGKL